MVKQGLLGGEAPTVFRLLILMRAGPSGEERCTRGTQCPSLLSALRRSVCQPCHVRCSRTQRSPASTSQSSARKRSGAEMLATPSGVSRAASSAFSCRCAVPGYQTGRSDYTRGQSPETGSLSRHLAVWEPLPSVSHRVLPAGFGFTSLVFLGDDAGLRTVTSIGDFG